MHVVVTEMAKNTPSSIHPQMNTSELDESEKRLDSKLEAPKNQ